MATLSALIIDGSTSYQQIATQLLRQAGFADVQCASTGQDGLALARQQTFHLVCGSYHLPDCSGSELCGQLRALPGYEYTSVIILTAEDNPRILKQVLLAGATDIFLKNNLADLETYLQRFSERENRILSGRVLFIEDSRVLQEVIVDLLTDMGLDVDAYTHAEGAWEAFVAGHYDLVITDIMLEGTMTGISLIRKIRRWHDVSGDVPIIAASGFDNLSRKIELFHLGVNDYIAKPIIREELRQRVYNHITAYQGMLELRAQQQSLQSLAMLDEVTHLFNRHALREFSQKYFAEAHRFNRPLTMAVVDIDHFRQINAQHGTDVADSILGDFGIWLKRFVRAEDIVARWSGDEFVFLFAACELAAAETLMQRLQTRLAQISFNNTTITVSIGLAEMSGEASSLSTLFEQADSAMYRAKMAGRNCIRFYQPEQDTDTAV